MTPSVMVVVLPNNSNVSTIGIGCLIIFNTLCCLDKNLTIHLGAWCLNCQAFDINIVIAFHLDALVRFLTALIMALLIFGR